MTDYHLLQTSIIMNYSNKFTVIDEVTKFVIYFFFIFIKVFLPAFVFRNQNQFAIDYDVFRKHIRRFYFIRNL